MSTYLDRSGIFKARPVSWKVKTFPNSNAVAISIEFAITAMLDGHDWQDWTSYIEHRCFGDFFVVKKDGSPNVKTIQQLSEALGWAGHFTAVFGMPPQNIVQITVKEESYNGKYYYKASWINPEDYAPFGVGADEQEVSALEARFGSLLRAAAGAAQKKAPPPTKKPEPQPQPVADPNDKIPF